MYITYKKNLTLGVLQCLNKTSPSLEQETSIIEANYVKASYPNAFINSIINYFSQSKEDFLISSTLFEK